MFTKGNKAASKGRKVEKILEGILRAEDDKRLKMGLEKVIEAVSEGDRWAIEFVTDRLDGKPKQAIEHSSDPEAPIMALVATSEELRKSIRGENK